MVKINVTRTIPAPIEKVFALITDHGNYKQFRGVNDSELLKEGDADKNGRGAKRRIQLTGVTFYEDITAYQPPYHYEYLIYKMTPPLLNHRVGRVTLKEAEGGTVVNWESESDVRIPIIGGIIGKRFAADGTKGFSSILKDIERKLTA